MRGKFCLQTLTFALLSQVSGVIYRSKEVRRKRRLGRRLFTSTRAPEPPLQDNSKPTQGAHDSSEGRPPRTSSTDKQEGNGIVADGADEEDIDVDNVDDEDEDEDDEDDQLAAEQQGEDEPQDGQGTTQHEGDEEGGDAQDFVRPEKEVDEEERRADLEESKGSARPSTSASRAVDHHVELEELYSWPGFEVLRRHVEPPTGNDTVYPSHFTAQDLMDQGASICKVLIRMYNLEKLEELRLARLKAKQKREKHLAGKPKAGKHKKKTLKRRPYRDGEGDDFQDKAVVDDVIDDDESEQEGEDEGIGEDGEEKETEEREEERASEEMTGDEQFEYQDATPDTSDAEDYSFNFDDQSETLLAEVMADVGDNLNEEESDSGGKSLYLFMKSGCER